MGTLLRDATPLGQQIDELSKEVTSINKEYQCIKRVCPDYFAGMKLGEKLLNLSNKIKKLLDEVNLKAVIPHFDSLATRTTVLQLIYRIKEKEHPKIGIYGPRGVGKTRVMQYLKRSHELIKNFDFVIWVTISNSRNIKKLQEQVQQCLSMKINSYESDEKVAEKIFQELLGKKYLLFLDDVRNMVDLGDLGFPNASTENGCKVVLATATGSVCWDMETDFDVKVEGFTEEEAWKTLIKNVFDIKVDFKEEEAWKMLIKNVFDITKVDFTGEEAWKVLIKNVPDIKVDFTEEEAWKMLCDLRVSPSTKDVAKEIANMCRRLPWSLQLVAGTLRKEENLDKWKKFSEDLSNAVDSNLDPIVFCFQKLEKIEKVCLTYCALHPEYHKIQKSRVINYMRASGDFMSDEESAKTHVDGDFIPHEESSAKTHVDGDFIPHEESSAKTHVDGDFILHEESLAKTHVDRDKIFYNLAKSSWLEICNGGGHVMMPVIIRDLLKEKRLLCPRVSSDLPTDFSEGYWLESVVLQGTGKLEPILELALKYMHEIKNLDLSGTNIKSLPDAIANMKSLRALFLKDCYFLETLPDKLGEVTTLEFLQVSGAWMPLLPLWIFKLESLKFLKFGYRSIARWWSAPHHYGIGQKDCEIPSGSVSKLTKIEVFNVSNFMYNSKLSKESLSSIAKEFGSLEFLSSLHFVFPTIEDLEHFLESTSWRNNVLKKFRFVVGEGKDFHKDIKKYKQCLKYNGGQGSCEFILPEAVLEVLTKSSFFELEKHEKIKCLSHLGEEATREVRHCGIHGCANLSAVIDKDGPVKNIFENLESLTLSNLLDFNGFDYGLDNTEAPGSFANLREVELQFCTQVRVIFCTDEVVRRLDNLEELRIKSCPNLCEVFSESNISRDSHLPKLKKVTLVHLPKHGIFPLDYALFQPLSSVKQIVDPNTLFHYESMFEAMVDATYNSISAFNFSNVPIVVTECGWPWHGEPNEPDATVQNAETFNNNLIRRVLNGSGPPSQPNIPISTYIYELLNEDKKRGPASERNWGLFFRNGSAVYDLNLSTSERISGNSSNVFCVAKKGASTEELEDGLSWACGPGRANCSAIQPGHPCYYPNNIVNHASYAYNDYYQKMHSVGGTCDFGGTATTAAFDPSYGSCIFTGSLNSSSGGLVSPVVASGPSSPLTGKSSRQLIPEIHLLLFATMVVVINSLRVEYLRVFVTIFNNIF